MKIFFASHGKMASGILSSIEILFGNTSDKLFVYDAYIDETSIYDVLDNYFESIEKNETVVLLSDLLGGSVNQAMIKYLERSNTYLIAGVNLTLVLELMATQEVDHLSLLELVNQSREMLMLVELEKMDLTIEEDEDFF